MSQIAPSPYNPNTGMMKPHRGTLILVLGIVGLAMSCCICGIIAWILGNADLREMDAGRMDPSGRGSTQAGKICGMISVILACIGIVVFILYLLFVFLILGVAAAGASQANP